MSNTAKVILTIVVIVVVLGGVYWWLMGQYSAQAPSAAPSAQTGGTSAVQQPALSSGNSNADLNQDLATIDSQMNAVASDTASVNSSFSDQPVAQTQP